MSIKILTKTGEEVTHIDDARAYNFDAGNRSGIVKGAYNEGRFFAVSNNVIGLDSCELRISGHRVIIDSAESITLTNTPADNTRYSMIAEIVVNDSSTPSFRLFIQPSTTPLTKDNLYKTAKGNGTYQLEIGRFTLTPSGLIDDVVRTSDVITGGTSGGDSNYIEIGNVTTNTISQGGNANVDIENVVDEQTGKTKTNFTFDIPSTTGTTVSVNGIEQPNISFKIDPQTQLDQMSNPNLLINGDFRINQRGLPSYNQINGYTVDRWRLYQALGSCVVTPNVNGGIIVDNTNGTTFATFRQYVESYNILANKTITISCNIKSISGNIQMYSQGTKSAIQYSNRLTVGLNAFTFTCDSTLTQVQIGLNLSASASVELEWLKLEIGSVATAFSPRPYAEELAMCQRYYIKNVTSLMGYSGYTNNDGTVAYITVSLPTSLRTVPTIPHSSITQFGYLRINGSAIQPTAITISTLVNNNVLLQCQATVSKATTACLMQAEFAFDCEIY